MNHEEFKAKIFKEDPELYKKYLALEEEYKKIEESISKNSMKDIKLLKNALKTFRANMSQSK